MDILIAESVEFEIWIFALFEKHYKQFAVFADINSLQNGLYLSQKCIAWLEIFTEVSHHFGESVIKFAKQMEKILPSTPINAPL